MMRRWKIWLVLVGLVAGFASGAAAQEPRQRPARDRSQMEQRIRAQMARMIKERLDLTDEQFASLSEVTRGFEQRRRQLFRADQATRRRAEAIVLEGGQDEDAARELLERVAELRRDELALFEEEQAALLEILPAHKVLQLQALREEMGRRIRSLRRGDGRRRSGDGRPGRDVRPGNVDGPVGVPLFGIPVG
jgi:Spy/CpxP family protein refolding chaperone